MADHQITDCHIHTFTSDHIPKWYPHPLAAPFRRVPKAVRAVAKGFAIVGQQGLAERLRRLAQLGETGGAGSQFAVFEQLLPLYSKGTRFVCLPMDMSEIGFGEVPKDLRSQHDELADLAQRPQFKDQILPFATIYPGKDGAVDEVKRCVEDLNFVGLKLYPRLGYPPDHPILMNEVYPYLVEKNLPVLSHCSRGGAAGRYLPKIQRDAFTDPAAFIPVMKEFPDLRVNLAHFGGATDWREYIDKGIDPRDPAARKRNWLASILDMLRSDEFPGLYTDISYTIFNFAEFISFLKVFMTDDLVRTKVLFGTDFYMTKQERLSERAVSFRLRDALNEEDFWQIAETNPKAWLGR